MNPEITEENDASLIEKLTETKTLARGAAKDILRTERISDCSATMSTPDKNFDIVSYRALRFSDSTMVLNQDGILNITTQKALNTKLEQAADNQDMQAFKSD